MEMVETERERETDRESGAISALKGKWRGTLL